MDDKRIFDLVQPDSEAAWNAARALVEEYAAQLGVDLGFQDFQREVDALPREYGPPDGCFFLARQGSAFVGCGAIRRFDATSCEMKRLYVVPAARGGHIGRAIAEALIDYAKNAGYETLRLDTLPAMTSAQKLYVELGFVQTAAYRYNPVPGATFWGLSLLGPAAESTQRTQRTPRNHI